MEDIKDRLGNYKYNFFNNLQNYVESELIFFGSIKRFDFLKNSSDIDIIIITDNVKSLLYKVQSFLNIKKTDIKKIYQQYSVNDNIVSGYKIKYDDKDSDMSFDLLIYDDKFRTDVMKNINDINNLPIYMLIILYILKSLHYSLYLIPKSIYNYLKCFIFYCYFNKKLLYYKREFSPVIALENFE
jgi:predicted nucleotidyltransferase